MPSIYAVVLSTIREKADGYTKAALATKLGLQQELTDPMVDLLEDNGLVTETAGTYVFNTLTEGTSDAEV
jgi:DNA-binding IclR family transcriptional regulator